MIDRRNSLHGAYVFGNMTLDVCVVDVWWQDVNISIDNFPHGINQFCIPLKVKFYKNREAREVTFKESFMERSHI
jgi:hypothetical protein